MKSLFDQFERLFGVRIDHLFPYAIAIVALFMFFSLKHQIASLSAEIEDVRATQNSVSSLSRSDLAPIQASVSQANTGINKLLGQSAMLTEHMPVVENAIDLANQKLTFLENQKGVTAGAPKP